ncbi:hypothetical protein SNE40_018980 [Patella caerulea]|uniref:Uncharacterized protein n=1 Tax=Patella caerulea TaxID=87958 RepID=A0AAN8J5Y8_PATCE
MKLYFLTLAIFISSISTARCFRTGNDTDPYLRPTLRALRAALQFLRREHRYINLDAVIGTRIVEGQMKVLLDRLRKKSPKLQLPADVLNGMEEIRLLSRYISEAAIPFIALRDTKYFTRIGDILSRGFWELKYESRDVDSDSETWPYTSDEAITEKMSDDCLTEYFGTGGNRDTCSISDKCWTRMTKRGYGGYSLSHEVFYLQIGQQFGCVNEMEAKVAAYNQQSIDNLQSTFCKVILAESNKYANENFPHIKQDLFMEEAALCGMLGFRQFFNTQWLLKILSWQDRISGCYKASDDEILIMKAKDMMVLNGRVKREERELPDKCLCHRTTVAAAALGQYVRYIIEAWEEDQKRVH